MGTLFKKMFMKMFQLSGIKHVAYVNTGKVSFSTRIQPFIDKRTQQVKQKINKQAKQKLKTKKENKN